MFLNVKRSKCLTFATLSCQSPTQCVIVLLHKKRKSLLIKWDLNACHIMQILWSHKRYQQCLQWNRYLFVNTIQVVKFKNSWDYIKIVSNGWLFIEADFKWHQKTSLLIYSTDSSTPCDQQILKGHFSKRNPSIGSTINFFSLFKWFQTNFFTLCYRSAFSFTSNPFNHQTLETKVIFFQF